jgi:peptide/nickel transport system substrate-binding protein
VLPVAGGLNEPFNALLPRIDTEVDSAKRLEPIRQAEAIMEQDPPLFPVAREKISDIWYNSVKGDRPDDKFGIYDLVRVDTFRLDK